MRKALFILLLPLAAHGTAGATCTEAEQFFNSGNPAEAEKALPLADGPKDQACVRLETRILISLGKFSEAEASALAALKTDPLDYKSALALARLYSWQDRFGDSAAFYDKAIALKPADYQPELEKARVLAWDKRYPASDKAYAAAFSKSGLDWIKEEQLGKEKMRGARPEQALAHFNKAVELEPANAEALFDLAQFYSNSGLYSKAEQYYKKLAEVSPYNTAANRSRAKNAAFGDGYAVRAGVSLWNADGADRMTDVKYLGSYISAEKHLSPALLLSLGGAHGHYSFTGAAPLDENSGRLSLEYRPAFSSGAGVSYSAKSLNRSPAAREEYNLFYWRKLRENLAGAVSYSRENFINSRAVFARNLDLDALKARLDWDADGSLSAGADYRAGHINDGNSLKLYGADARYYFSREPSALYAQFRYERQNYDGTSALYFAPAAYDLHALTAGYRLNFGPDGLYYGARGDYFEAKCRAAYDNSPYLSFNPSLLLNLGLGGTLNLQAAYSLTASHYYRDNYYSLSAVKAF